MMQGLTETLPYFTMEQNVVLQAGAGTGKTHTLVTLALHLLSGANARRRPIAPARLVALTFTEKAGAEMRERLQERMAPLAAGQGLAREPELELSFRALGVPPPSPAFWSRLRRDVSLATVGTFHSFCALQLRRFAAEAGLDPGFSVLDEEESRALFDESVEGYVRRALADREPHVRALVDEFGLTDDRDSGLLDLARAVLSRLAEDGREPASLLDGRFTDSTVKAALGAKAARLQHAVRACGGMSAKTLARLGTAVSEMEAAASEFATAAGEPALERLQLLRKGFRKPTGADGLLVDAFDEALKDARGALASVRAAPLGRAFIEVLSAMDERYRAAKATREALDFSDLQRRLRDLLRDDLAVRRELKGRIDTLLVDEFQDTSRLQFELVALLAEERGQESAIEPGEIASQIRWAPDMLCAVGDRKQSIYEFRGADVAVFRELETALTGPTAPSPARIEHLQRSFRSRPRLVSCVNELFRRAMPAALQPFEVAFGAGDALEPAREDPAPGENSPLVEVLESRGDRAEEHRADEAERIAARIARMLGDPEDTTRVRDRDERLRKVEGRDITILFRRLTQLDVYRRALTARGLPHVVVGGDGFYQSLEVLDGWALLAVLADPWHATASMAVLRGPWCGLSDPTLAGLAVDDDGRRRPPTVGRLLREAVKFEGPEAERLNALLRFVERFSPEFDRLGAPKLLGHAVERLGYLAVAARTGRGDAAAANLSKLLMILERLEGRSATPRGTLRKLEEKIRDEQREPEAPVAEEADARSIRLMSIHQSKGLQFPVVFIADCGATETAARDRIAFERDLGLALNVRFDTGDLVGMPELTDIRERLAARSAAESLRLLYVAATRARDHLVFSGAMKKGSWLELVASLGSDWVRHLPPTESPRLPAVPPPEDERFVPAVAHPSVAPRVAIHNVTATVTRLQDFALCPERYRLRHDLGLAEHPPAALEESEDDELETPLDVFARGTLAHRLLEVLDFPSEQADTLRERLSDLVRAEGYDPGRPEIAEICEDVLAFLQTEFGRVISQLRPAQRLRELPFFLSLDLGDERRLQVKGQVDFVAVSGDGVRIIDYKHARHRTSAAAQYRFQLVSYAVAVREMLEHTPLPVDVGLAFLRERGRELELDRLSTETLDEHVEELRRIGRALVDAHESRRWERRPKSHCDAIGCGYRARCHREEER